MTADAIALDSMRGFSTSMNPATDEEIARFPWHRPAEREAVVAAAWQGYQAWREQSVEARANKLSVVAERLRDRSERLARCITQEMGKPITAARAEVLKCSKLCDWYSEHAAEMLREEYVDVGSDGEARIAHLPLGPVLAIMPWNFPLWQVLRAAVPIIVAGNSFVLKHADNVQGSAFALAEVFADAGLPDGVFSVLNVSRAVLPALIADRRIAAVTVTAGVAAGAAVASEAGQHLKKAVLELGGSDPFIVLADADLDRAVNTAIQARFQNAGQVCIAAKRIIVERSIANAFTERFVAAAAELVAGDPMDEATQLGPLARRRLRSELHELVQQSLAQGAKLLLGGTIPDGPGAFYPPTVLVDVTSTMAVCREETFGPVACIMTADDADDAVRIANESEFGLSGAIWSADETRAGQLARRVETGGVFVNGMSTSDPRVPIGGIKKSGYGRELSYFGIREFCNAQLLWQRP
ncbi:NAD-dependent succinate-semialdehyde dehydrogenase [Sphingobium sp. H39-3-25]|uniref:NAD-dependent succinate-semialdehyde dehydrogenase n=1 Tax=Sphingobium arseniciresistens TaxID=3030834 RepID=UPI0023B8F033|nr:NAD-dependent succinate-semialdehyde dehydrogenase [Sphingobium arseniciresistens]